MACPNHQVVALLNYHTKWWWPVAIQRLAKLECEQNTGKERLTTMVDDGRRAGDLRIYVDRRIMYRMPKRKFNKAVDGGKREKGKKW
jgi:hypothetical protein